MSSEGEAKERTQMDVVNDEIELIMAALSKKGDIIPELKELLADKTKITTDGLMLKQVFLEIIFTKFGSHSLEHVTRGIEKVSSILDEHYKGNEEAQKMALETIFKAFNMD